MSTHIFNSQSEASTPASTKLSEDVFVFPASYSQQRLWLLDQIEGESATYNMSMVLMLSGMLDVSILERSLLELVMRHEALRTNFQMVDDSLVQVIAETSDFCLQIVEAPIDGDPLPLSLELENLIAKITKRPFNLAQDSLFRVTLLRLTATQHILLVTMHHIISDAWSMSVFKRDLTALYDAFKSDRPSPLQPLQIQYADFADWQRDFLSGDRLNAHLDYWREKLTGLPPLLTLPTVRPRPAVQSFKGKTAKFSLTPTLTQQLKTVSQQSQATVFMTLLAAFSVLLSRYSSYDDIAIGSPIANRQQRELEALIGCFVNTLVLRISLKNNPTFKQLLAQVRQTALEAYEHQDLPFEKLVEELQPERSLSHSPLFQVMFILQNAPKSSHSLGDLEIRPIKRKKTIAKFDLTLTMTEKEEGFIGAFEYNSDLFDPATIDRAIGHFKILLENIVNNPEKPVSALPILSDRERRQLLIDWNKTTDNTISTLCIHELFEQQVARIPDDLALIVESTNNQSNEQLTYRELNHRADLLAGYLRTQNLPPESLIGICLDRSANMMVALLGILKAGLAYVPLDPTYPVERSIFTIADARISVLLTQQNLISQLGEHSARVVCLDRDWQTIVDVNATQSKSASRTNSVNLDRRAYVIYTSGTTGKPKGVEVTHRSLSNFLQAMAKKPGITDRDTLLGVTTLSFDIAALELFLPLIVGAKVILVDSEIASDATLLCPVLNRCNATIMQATPATWQMLIAAGWSGNSQIKLLCGGEALSSELAQQLISRSDALWNMYGPTEATIWSTCSKIESANSPISIGKPIANTQAYILDKFQNPVPIGSIGELYIGGVGLAKGYLNRPELTENKFISNPLAIAKADGETDRTVSSKLYKTGDLARYRPDGNIECLGRTDNQVKLRGFRIELGEIESVLMQQDSVSQAVAAVREYNPNDKRLIAYCVASEPTTIPTTEEQRNFLQQRLPHYMVPYTFVWLDEFPKTPNGKIDRAALPTPDWSNQNSQVVSVPPSNPLEKQIADTWAAVLDLTSVGIHDNFFALGGHSLSAARVISRLRAALEIELTLRHLFEATTIAELSRLIEDLQQKNSAGTTTMTIPRSSRRR